MSIFLHRTVLSYLVFTILMSAVTRHCFHLRFPVGNMEMPFRVCWPFIVFFSVNCLYSVLIFLLYAHLFGKSSLYILDSNPLSIIHVENVLPNLLCDQFHLVFFTS